MGLWQAILVFLLSAAVLVKAGSSLAAYADQIAERMRMSRLFVGTLMLAFATSLPEVVTDITAARADAPEIDGNLFIDEGHQGLKPGDIVTAEVDETGDYDLWGRLVQQA